MTDRDLDILADFIINNDRFVLATHLNPDGDALGCTLALGSYIGSLSKDVYMVYGNDQPVPDQYRFLPCSDCFVKAEVIPSNVGAFIALDCSTRDRLGDIEPAFQASDKTANIDHHRDNNMFATINVVDEASASCSEIVYRLIKRLAKKTGNGITTDEALCLYTGMVTDTGRFQYSSTSAKTLTAAAELLDLGVDPSFVFRNVYENQSLARIKLWGVAYLKAQIDMDTGVISTVVTEEDFKNTGTTSADAEDLVDKLRAVKNIQVAVLMKENEEGLKVSLRSTGKVDVGRIASIFGGGGHAMAAGFSTDLDENALLERIRSIVKNKTGEKS